MTVDDHIHMLGCQALTEARNLGYAEAKGETTNDDALLEMIEKHEKLLSSALLELMEKVIGEDELIWSPSGSDEKSVAEYARETRRIKAQNELRQSQREALRELFK